GRNSFFQLNGGNLGIGTSTPATRLHVDGGEDLDPSGGGYMLVGSATASIRMDNNEIQAYVDDLASSGALHLQRDGGKVMIGANVAVGTADPEGKMHLQCGSTDIGLYVEGGWRDIGWPSDETLQMGQWDGATFTPRMLLSDNELQLGDTVFLQSHDPTKSDQGGQLVLKRSDGTETVQLDAEESQLTPSGGGVLFLSTATGQQTIEIRAQETSDPTNTASIRLFNDLGEKTIELDADENGCGYVESNAVRITGGCDFAEPFQTTDDVEISAGSLVVIDEDNPGRLKVCETAYDRRVAGVVSGAGGVKPGITLSQKGVMEDGQNVALSGRVYALADASYGQIRPGDMLTTSPTTGHAMKASEREKSHGAIIGKAMTSLESGQGLVLVLVSLQ
ncbi:MAG: hypothetical protein ABIG68_01830, partial [Acidobacteriota bacterium]